MDAPSAKASSAVDAFLILPVSNLTSCFALFQQVRPLEQTSMGGDAAADQGQAKKKRGASLEREPPRTMHVGIGGVVSYDGGPVPAPRYAPPPAFHGGHGALPPPALVAGGLVPLPHPAYAPGQFVHRHPPAARPHLAYPPAGHHAPPAHPSLRTVSRDYGPPAAGDYGPPVLAAPPGTQRHEQERQAQLLLRVRALEGQLAAERLQRRVCELERQVGSHRASEDRLRRELDASRGGGEVFPPPPPPPPPAPSTAPTLVHSHQGPATHAVHAGEGYHGPQAHPVTHEPNARPPAPAAPPALPSTHHGHPTHKAQAPGSSPAPAPSVPNGLWSLASASMIHPAAARGPADAAAPATKQTWC